MTVLNTSEFKGWPSKDCKPLLNLVFEPEDITSRYQLNFVREKDDLDWHQAAHFYDSELGPVVLMRYDNSPMSGCGIYIDSGTDIHFATERLIAVLQLDKRDINWSVVDDLRTQKSIDDFKAYIVEVGLDKHLISAQDLQLSLYHDLGIYGDTAQSCIDVLADSYKVDLSHFEFDKYFPPEFEGESFLQRVFCSVLPFYAAKLRASKEYQRLTCADVKNAIELGVLK